MAADLTERIKLPSKGLIYDSALEIPEEITIRAMTTKEEKSLYGSSNNFIDYIIKQCIVEPLTINLKKLLPADKIYILFRIRVLTYGPEYHITYRCPFCNAVEEYDVNLDGLEVNYLPEDFKEPFSFKLPRSGDTLEVALLRDEDIDDISEKAKRMKKRSPEAVGDFEYTLRMAKYIKTVNGDKLPEPELLSYLDSMVGRDSASFWAQLNKIKVGLADVILDDCKKCHSEIEIPLALNGEFFHPRYDD